MDSACRNPGLGLMVAVAVLLVASSLLARNNTKYQAALLALAPSVPVVAIVVSLVVYMTWLRNPFASVVGGSIAASLWALAALLGRDWPSAERCNQSSYGELRYRLTQLDAHLAIAPGSTPDSAATLQATEQRAAIEGALSNGADGLSWVTANGYIQAWKRLHRAEEALIELLPQELVFARALEDELRLTGSKITNSADLLAKLRQALITLDPDGKTFLRLSAEQAKVLSPVPEPSRTAPRAADEMSENVTLAVIRQALEEQRDPDLDSVLLRLSEEQRARLLRSHATPDEPVSLAPSQAKARAVLKMIRRAINEYVDNLYDGLVTTRNRVWGQALVTGATAYLLLTVALVMRVDCNAVGIAAAFFLVGALVGLLNRLRSDAEESKEVQDYGLSNARLFSLPLFSGLAGLFGVVVVQGVPQLISATSATSAPPPIWMSSIFRNQNLVAGCLLAGMFGLTPDLLFSKLRQQGEQYKSDLKSSEATQSKSAD